MFKAIEIKYTVLLYLSDFSRSNTEFQFFGVRKAIDVFNNVFLIEQRKIKLVKYDIRKAFLWKQIKSN